MNKSLYTLIPHQLHPLFTLVDEYTAMSPETIPQTVLCHVNDSTSLESYNRKVEKAQERTSFPESKYIKRVFEQKFDEQSWTIESFFEFQKSNIDLKLSSLANNGKEIARFLQDLLMVSIHYADTSMLTHGDIRPELIFFNSDGNYYTVFERLSLLANQNVAQYGTILNNRVPFMTPQLYEEEIKDNFGYVHNEKKSEVFSIGMVFLYLTIGESGWAELYNKKDKIFNKVKFAELLEDFKRKFNGVHFELTKLITDTILAIEEKDREEPEVISERIDQLFPGMGYAKDRKTSFLGINHKATLTGTSLNLNTSPLKESKSINEKKMSLGETINKQSTTQKTLIETKAGNIEGVSDGLNRKKGQLVKIDTDEEYKEVFGTTVGGESINNKNIVVAGVVVLTNYELDKNKEESSKNLKSLKQKKEDFWKDEINENKKKSELELENKILKINEAIQLTKASLEMQPAKRVTFPSDEKGEIELFKKIGLTKTLLEDLNKSKESNSNKKLNITIEISSNLKPIGNTKLKQEDQNKKLSETNQSKKISTENKSNKEISKLKEESAKKIISGIEKHKDGNTKDSVLKTSQTKDSSPIKPINEINKPKETSSKKVITNANVKKDEQANKTINETKTPKVFISNNKVSLIYKKTVDTPIKVVPDSKQQAQAALKTQLMQKESDASFNTNRRPLSCKSDKLSLNQIGNEDNLIAQQTINRTICQNQSNLIPLKPNLYPQNKYFNVPSNNSIMMNSNLKNVVIIQSHVIIDQRNPSPNRPNILYVNKFDPAKRNMSPIESGRVVNEPPRNVTPGKGEQRNIVYVQQGGPSSHYYLPQEQGNPGNQYYNVQQPGTSNQGIQGQRVYIQTHQNLTREKTPNKVANGQGGYFLQAYSNNKANNQKN